MSSGGVGCHNNLHRFHVTQSHRQIHQYLISVKKMQHCYCHIWLVMNNVYIKTKVTCGKTLTASDCLHLSCSGITQNIANYSKIQFFDDFMLHVPYGTRSASQSQRSSRSCLHFASFWPSVPNPRYKSHKR